MGATLNGKRNGIELLASWGEWEWKRCLHAKELNGLDLLDVFPSRNAIGWNGLPFSPHDWRTHFAGVWSSIAKHIIFGKTKVCSSFPGDVCPSFPVLWKRNYHCCAICESTLRTSTCHSCNFALCKDGSDRKGQERGAMLHFLSYQPFLLNTL